MAGILLAKSVIIQNFLALFDVARGTKNHVGQLRLSKARFDQERPAIDLFRKWAVINQPPQAIVVVLGINGELLRTANNVHDKNVDNDAVLLTEHKFLLEQT